MTDDLKNPFNENRWRDSPLAPAMRATLDRVGDGEREQEWTEEERERIAEGLVTAIVRLECGACPDHTFASFLLETWPQYAQGGVHIQCCESQMPICGDKEPIDHVGGEDATCLVCAMTENCTDK